MLVGQVVWLEEVLAAAAQDKLRTGALTFADRMFENEINTAVRHTQQVKPLENYLAPRLL